MHEALGDSVGRNAGLLYKELTASAQPLMSADNHVHVSSVRVLPFAWLQKAEMANVFWWVDLVGFSLGSLCVQCGHQEGQQNPSMACERWPASRPWPTEASDPEGFYHRCFVTPAEQINKRVYKSFHYSVLCRIKSHAWKAHACLLFWGRWGGDEECQLRPKRLS